MNSPSSPVLEQDKEGRWWWRRCFEPIADQWALARLVPFNSSDVERLVKKAETQLSKLTGDPSITSYLKEPGWKAPDLERRVACQVQAIFETLQKLKPAITYRVEPPESDLRDTWQRIRLADEALRLRYGCCLDLSLFFAACLRQANLLPIILITGDSGGPNHALVGWWKDKKKSRKKAVLLEAEIMRCRKRWEVVNATRIAVETSKKFVTFDEAIWEANTHLPSCASDQEIYCAVDVAAALAKHKAEPVIVPAMLGFLTIIDVTAELSLHLSTYERREELERQLQEWIDNHERGYLVLTADAGGGKTALISHLIANLSLAAFHIIKAGRSPLDEPDAFCESLYRQILRTYNLNDEPEKPLRTGRQRLHAVMTRLSPTLRDRGKKAIILVDGLDECWGPGRRATGRRPELTEIFPTNPDIGFCFILTSRRGDFLNALTRLDLCDTWRLEGSQFAADTTDTMVRYLVRRFPELRSRDDLRALLLDKVKGNFLFAVKICNGLAGKPLSLAAIVALPDDLQAWMKHAYDGVLENSPPGDVALKVLGFLAVQRASFGLTRDDLVEFVSATVKKPDYFRLAGHVDGVLRRAGEFLTDILPPTGMMPPYRIYHELFAEFLCQELGLHRLKTCHEHMAKVCLQWKKYKRTMPSLHDYALAYLPTHLCEAERWDTLAEVLTDLSFIEAKCAAGMTNDLLRDYNMALEALPEARAEREQEQKHQERVKRYIRDLILCAEGKIARSELDIIPSVKPKTEEELLAERERIIAQPGRLERIRAFASFVRAEAHNLQTFGDRPGFCLQQAYNFARSGPVAEAAKKLVEKETSQPLLLARPFSRPDYNPRPALLQTLSVHDRWVFSVSVSITHDGKRAISASRKIFGGKDDTLRLWDLETGACLRTLAGHTSLVESVSITPDGKWAITAASVGVIHGSRDNTAIQSLGASNMRVIHRSADLRLWDLETGKCLRTLTVQTGYVTSVSITPDGIRAISGSADKSLRLWDLETGKCLRTLTVHTGYVTSVRITPDGKRAISASKDNTLRLWDLETGACLRTLAGHTRSVESVSITPDGKRAVSGSADKSLRFWDLEMGKCFRTLTGHTSSVESVSITPDGKRALSGSDDKTLRLWDLETGACLRTLIGHTGSVESVSITPDGKWALSGSGGNILRWDLETGGCLRRTLAGHTSSVESVTITPDGKQAITAGGGDGTLRLWEVETGACLWTFTGHASSVESVTITPDGKRVISGSDEKTLRLWDVETGVCLRTFASHTGRVSSVSITPDGKHAISGSMNTLHLWDVETGACLQALTGHIGNLIRVSITPDGKWAISGSGNIFDGFDYALRLWDLETGSCLRTLTGHTGAVMSVGITPDGKQAISGSFDNTLRLWDVETGACLRTLAGHTASVASVSITPDGKQAISGSDDQTLRLWDLEAGVCLGIYITQRSVCSVSTVVANGNLAVGLSSGEILFIELRHLYRETPLVTATRLWVSGGKRGAWPFTPLPDRWEDTIGATCPWCGTRFPAPEPVLTEISEITRENNLPPDQSPCLALPAAAWDRPGLKSQCPSCQKPLRYNPFVVDNRERE